mmetsp:Transcript_40167/g.76771  ORF Transcript_40167/g.76771 Transcript_40167/m.76771 type:complete len:200 (+) Transcript_40167:801-1400(+)
MRHLRSLTTTSPPQCSRRWRRWQASSSCRTTTRFLSLNAASTLYQRQTWRGKTPRMTTSSWTTTSMWPTCSLISEQQRRTARRLCNQSCCSRSACSGKRTNPSQRPCLSTSHMSRLNTTTFRATTLWGATMRRSWRRCRSRRRWVRCFRQTQKRCLGAWRSTSPSRCCSLDPTPTGWRTCSRDTRRWSSSQRRTRACRY